MAAVVILVPAIVGGLLLVGAVSWVVVKRQRTQAGRSRGAASASATAPAAAATVPAVADPTALESGLAIGDPLAERRVQNPLFRSASTSSQHRASQVYQSKRTSTASVPGVGIIDEDGNEDEHNSGDSMAAAHVPSGELSPAPMGALPGSFGFGEDVEPLTTPLSAAGKAATLGSAGQASGSSNASPPVMVIHEGKRISPKTASELSIEKAGLAAPAGAQAGAKAAERPASVAVMGSGGGGGGGGEEAAEPATPHKTEGSDHEQPAESTNRTDRLKAIREKRAKAKEEEERIIREALSILDELTC